MNFEWTWWVCCLLRTASARGPHGCWWRESALLHEKTEICGGAVTRDRSKPAGRPAKAFGPGQATRAGSLPHYNSRGAPRRSARTARWGPRRARGPAPMAAGGGGGWREPLPVAPIHRRRLPRLSLFPRPRRAVRRRRHGGADPGDQQAARRLQHGGGRHHPAAADRGGGHAGEAGRDGAAGAVGPHRPGLRSGRPPFLRGRRPAVAVSKGTGGRGRPGRPQLCPRPPPVRSGSASASALLPPSLPGSGANGCGALRGFPPPYGPLSAGMESGGTATAGVGRAAGFFRLWDLFVSANGWQLKRPALALQPVCPSPVTLRGWTSSSRPFRCVRTGRCSSAELLVTQRAGWERWQSWEKWKWNIKHDQSLALIHHLLFTYWMYAVTWCQGSYTSCSAARYRYVDLKAPTAGLRLKCGTVFLRASHGAGLVVRQSALPLLNQHHSGGSETVCQLPYKRGPEHWHWGGDFALVSYIGSLVSVYHRSPSLYRNFPFHLH